MLKDEKSTASARATIYKRIKNLIKQGFIEEVNFLKTVESGEEADRGLIEDCMKKIANIEENRDVVLRRL